MERFFEQFGMSPAALAEMMKSDTPHGRSAAPGDYLAITLPKVRYC